MTRLFGKEVIELALQLEKSGGAFYNAVAKKAPDDDMAGFFKEMARQEDEHYKRFEQLLDKVNASPVYLTEGAWEEFDTYLHAAVSQNFFEGPDKALTRADKVKSMKEAVRVSLDFEKETLLFYYGLRDMVHEVDTHIISAVIEEEKSHIRSLAARLSSLS